MNTRLIAVFIAVVGSSICSATDLNVAAHEDDDLLFMNPEIADSIAVGNTVHTVYRTAGDVEGKPWLEGREEEMKAACRLMAGVSPDASWLPITVTAAGKSI